MCIFSDHERAFDEGHLELLRVLASEASIAIENARLFQEERTKARHLNLLNLISRDAIATLNPDEILAKIAEQLENGLTYDHIGIAILDYTTRELDIQAESGKRRGAWDFAFPWTRVSSARSRAPGKSPRSAPSPIRRTAPSPFSPISYRHGPCPSFTPIICTAFCMSKPSTALIFPKRNRCCSARLPT